jgi:hypothetical protein
MHQDIPEEKVRIAVNIAAKCFVKTGFVEILSCVGHYVNIKRQQSDEVDCE